MSEQPEISSPITYFWDPSEPDRIHLWIKDERFTDSEGERPGIWNVYSINPRSADYSPSNFNRVARALRAEERPAPAGDAPELDRRLRNRQRLIDDHSSG